MRCGSSIILHSNLHGNAVRFPKNLWSRRKTRWVSDVAWSSLSGALMKPLPAPHPLSTACGITPTGGRSNMVDASSSKNEDVSFSSCTWLQLPRFFKRLLTVPPTVKSIYCQRQASSPCFGVVTPFGYSM